MSFCLFYFSAQINFRSLFNLFIQPHRCLLWVDKRFSSTYVLNKSGKGRVMFFCSVWWHRDAGGPELFGTSCPSQAQVWVEIPIEPQAFHPTHGGGKYSSVLPACLLPPLQPSKEGFGGNIELTSVDMAEVQGAAFLNATLLIERWFRFTAPCGCENQMAPELALQVTWKKHNSFFRLLLGKVASPNLQLVQISETPLKSIKIDWLTVLEDLHCWPLLKSC